MDKDFTCYSLTMAGFAGNKAHGAASFAAWETATAAWIKNKKIEKPIIIGHSLGGVLAMALAADHPDMPGAIAIVDALPCLPALMNPKFQVKSDQDCAPLISRFTAKADSDFFRMQKMTASSFTKDTSRQAEIIKHFGAHRRAVWESARRPLTLLRQEPALYHI